MRFVLCEYVDFDGMFKKETRKCKALAYGKCSKLRLANEKAGHIDVKASFLIKPTVRGFAANNARPALRRQLYKSRPPRSHLPVTTLIHSWKMPPALHPRSRQTGALFTGTLAVCFLVVGAPHILPCPVNPKQFADTIEGPDGQPIRRRRRRKQTTEDSGSEGDAAEAYDALMSETKKKRECPVPKPGGIVGQVMGFKEHESQKPSPVVVKELQGRRAGQKHVDGIDTP
jgi:cytochrome c oxidase assembly factor 2